MSAPAGAPSMRWLCRPCRAEGACRLGIRAETLLEPGRMRAELACAAPHEGGAGIAHGGWVAGVMDDLLGHLALAEGRLAVTAVLTVEFLKPVPIERPLTALVWCEGRDGGRRRHVGELRLGSDGAILATARGVFVERDEEHYRRHRDWLRRQDLAAADGTRAVGGDEAPGGGATASMDRAREGES